MKFQKKISNVNFNYKKTISLLAINLYLILYIVFNNISTIYATEHILEPTLEQDELNNLDILSESVLLYDVDNNIVLYEKNGYEKKYPASITKIMTALLTLENSSLDESVYFSHDAVFSIPYNSSHIAMNEDETLSVKNALYGLMLESANEVSNALAEHVSGTSSDFATLMTERAKELGATNTNFINPHGLHDDNHYTTAYDMALIMQEVIKYDTFNEIGGTYYYKIPPTEKQPEERNLHNSNRMINSNSSYYNSDVVVGKTGFTDEAQHTLVTYANRDDINLVAVVMYGSRYEPYVDTETLLQYGFSSYDDVTIQSANDYFDTINIFAKKEHDSTNYESGTTEQVDNPIGEIDLYTEKANVKIPSNIAVNLEKDITYDNYVDKSIEIGDVVGNINYLYKDSLILSAPIFAKTSFSYDNYLLSLKEKENVEVIKTFTKKTILIFIMLFSILLVFIFIFRQYNLRNKKKYIYKKKRYRNKYKERY